MKASRITFAIALIIIILSCQNKMSQPYNYLLKLPDGYSENSPTSLLIFLHGAGERGDDLELVKKHGPPKQIKEGQKFPQIVLSPQCPSDDRWDPDRLQATLEEIMSTYNVDPTRMYLTGLSMGGQGTWKWAGSHPSQFRAIAPICGFAAEVNFESLKDLPIWVFHGAKDDVVAIEESDWMVQELKKVGSDVKYTVYPELKHDSWSITYENSEFYSWLFAQ